MAGASAVILPPSKRLVASRARRGGSSPLIRRTGMGRLDGKVALITGGARGMGKAHVRHFAAEGARGVFGDVLDEKGPAGARQRDPTAWRHPPPDRTSEAGWAAAR